jgi:hypothetical protein
VILNFTISGLETRGLAMKLKFATAAFVIAATPAFFHSTAMAQTRGVSQPDSSPITESTDEAPQRAAKPSPATPAPSKTPSSEVYGPYVPYQGPKSAGAPTRTPLSKSAYDPDANIVTSVERQPEDKTDYDKGVVTSVPEREGEIREGTLVKVRVLKSLSTATTVEGTDVTAELTEPVEKNGRVILPIGSVMLMRVTQIHSGKRISGAAAIHLEPHSVTLPDGTQYLLHAQLIDTSQDSNTRVNNEGTLLRRDHAKETMAVLGGVTGAGAVAGAMIGGGPGALIGAGIGAGAGTVVWLKQDRQASLPEDSRLVFSLTAPMPLKPFHVGSAGGQ